MATTRGEAIKEAGGLEDRVGVAKAFRDSARTEMASIGYFITAVRGASGNVTGPQYAAAYAIWQTIKLLSCLPGTMFVSKKTNFMAEVLEGLALYLRSGDDMATRPSTKKVYTPTAAPYIDMKASFDATATIMSHALERVSFKYAQKDLPTADAPAEDEDEA